VILQVVLAAAGVMDRLSQTGRGVTTSVAASDYQLWRIAVITALYPHTHTHTQTFFIKHTLTLEGGRKEGRERERERERERIQMLLKSLLLILAVGFYTLLKLLT